jgi:hypothetical protein
MLVISEALYRKLLQWRTETLKHLVCFCTIKT